MNFEENGFSRRIGKKVGYFFAYLVFSAALYFILRFVHKIPDDWNPIYILPFTLAIILLGKLITLLLK